MGPRRRKVRFTRNTLRVFLVSLPCSSFPTQTHFVGLCAGPLRRPLLLPLFPLNAFIKAFFANFLSRKKVGGDSRDRTGDLLLARQALSQLSYIPSSSQTSYHSLQPPAKARSLRCSSSSTQTHSVGLCVEAYLSRRCVRPLN